MSNPNRYLIFSNNQYKVKANCYAYYYLGRRKTYLKNMHNNLMKYDYNSSFNKDLGIIRKVFIPENLKDVPAHYYELISVITEYFSCRAVWVIKFPKGTVNPIHTFEIYGYKPDVYLCHKFMNFEINNIQLIHFNRTLYLRKRVRKANRRGNNRMKNIRTTTSMYIRRLLYNIGRAWEKILENRQDMIYHEEKIQGIYLHLRENKIIDFGKKQYKNKPNIERAFCRSNRFIKNKIIVYKEVTPFVY